MPLTATETTEQRERIFNEIMLKGQAYYAQAYDFEKKRWDDAVLRRVENRIEATDPNHFRWEVSPEDLADPKQFRSFIPKLH